MSSTPGNRTKGKKEEALFSHSSTQNYKCLNIPSTFTGSIFKYAFLIEPWNNFSLYIAFISLGPTCPRPIWRFIYRNLVWRKEGGFNLQRPKSKSLFWNLFNYWCAVTQGFPTRPPSSITLPWSCSNHCNLNRSLVKSRNMGLDRKKKIFNAFHTVSLCPH